MNYELVDENEKLHNENIRKIEDVKNIKKELLESKKEHNIKAKEDSTKLHKAKSITAHLIRNIEREKK